MVQYIWHLPRMFLIGIITLYQRTLSPDHGPLKGLHPYGFCRHEPTCSMYAKNTLKERGAAMGMILSVKRMLCCNPWTKPDEQRIRTMLKKST